MEKKSILKAQGPGFWNENSLGSSSRWEIGVSFKSGLSHPPSWNDFMPAYSNLCCHQNLRGILFYNLGSFPQQFLNIESNTNLKEGLHVVDNKYLWNSFNDASLGTN